MHRLFKWNYVSISVVVGNAMGISMHCFELLTKGHASLWRGSCRHKVMTVIFNGCLLSVSKHYS